MITRLLHYGPSRRRLADWRRCTSGVATIEFLFTVMFLAVLAVGAADFGRYAFAQLSLASAARAGAQYGIQDQSTANAIDAMKQAARDDVGDDDDSLTVDARQYCACPDGSEVSCSDTCGDGEYAQMYVEVTVGNEISLLFDYPGVAEPIPISATAIIRVR